MKDTQTHYSNIANAINTVVEKKFTNSDKIKSIKAGETLQISGDGVEYNRLYDEFKALRKSKVLAMSFDAAKNTITVTNLQTNDSDV